jgi:hypothetical protein
MYLNDTGRLDYETKVSSFWPEFARGGKENVTIGDLSSYTACLPAIDFTIHMNQTLDHDLFDTYIANTSAQPSYCVIGLNGGYVLVVKGNEDDGMVRRLDATHRDIHAQVIENIISRLPISNAEWHVNMNSTLTPRVALLTNATSQAAFAAFAPFLCSTPGLELQCKAATNIPELSTVFSVNQEDVRDNSFVPGASSYSNAWTADAMMAQIAHYPSAKQNGIFKHRKTISLASEIVWEGLDYFSGVNTTYTEAGFETPVPSNNFSPNPEAVGKSGTGGQIIFADPEEKASFAFLSNDIYYFTDVNVNAQALIEEYYAILAA